jgi:L-seryl-tRNA(Ser) seleniumtransferase
MRPDKVTLAAMAATLALYRAGTATRDIPVWRMIGQPVESLRERATKLRGWLDGRVLIVDSRATIGGGSLPGETLASVALQLPGKPERVLAALRAGSQPVVGRIEEGHVLLDLRTVPPELDDSLASAVGNVLGAG